MKEQKIKCRACGYEWIPRKEPSQVKECPACKSRLARQKKK